MAFLSSGSEVSTAPVGSGELWDGIFAINTDRFDAANIKTGKFASFDGGILKTGITGTLAGVVCRNIAGSLEVDETDDVHDRTSLVRFVRAGTITVDVLTGNVPVFAGKVYTDVDGKATTNVAKTPTNAEFIREVKADVWLIRLI